MGSEMCIRDSPTSEEIEKENNTEKLELPSTENKETFKDTYTTNVDPAAKKIVKSNFGIFSESSYDEEKEVILENEKIKLVISNKGGQIKSATVKEGPNQKKYTTYTGEELEIFNTDSSVFNLNFSTGLSINTKDLFFKKILYLSKYLINLLISPS